LRKKATLATLKKGGRASGGNSAALRRCESESYHETLSLRCFKIRVDLATVEASDAFTRSAWNGGSAGSLAGGTISDAQ
jgi:hypothetical protein